MNRLNSQKALNRLTKEAANQYPVSIPCLIFKENDDYQPDFTYVIDKDVLGQIIYEVLKESELVEDCIPVIISLKDNAINRLESKGVYILDSFNNQFIYLFGTKDQKKFFDSINKITREWQFDASLIVGYLSNEENQIDLHQKYANELNRLLDLHGNIYSKYIPLENSEEIKFPLLNGEFKLNLVRSIIRRDGVAR